MRRRRRTVATAVGVVSLLAAIAAPSAAAPEASTLRDATDDVWIGLTASVGDPDHRAIALAEADTVLNHGLSWNVIEPVRGTWDFRQADRVHTFAEANDLRQIGLHFAWDQRALDDLPAWVLDIDDPDELRAVLRERARVLAERYAGIERVDVINEPLATLGSTLEQNHFAAVLGQDYIAELFHIVDAEWGDTSELFLNEAFVEYSRPKAEALVDLVAGLVADGVPIDAVGLQTHLLFGEPDWGTFRWVMDALDALGVAVLVSELDVPVEPGTPDRDAVQSSRYRRVVETCLAVPACDEINVYGVDDGGSWLEWFLGPGRTPLLYDDAFERKPAWFAVRDALAAGRPSPSTTTTAPASTTSSATSTVPSPSPAPTSATVGSGVAAAGATTPRATTTAPASTAATAVPRLTG